MGSAIGLPYDLEQLVKLVTSLLGSTTTLPFGSSEISNSATGSTAGSSK